VCQVHGLAQQQGLIVLNKSAPGVSSAPGGGTADPQAALVQQLRLQQLIQQQQHGAVGGAGGGATVQLRPTTANQYTAQQPTQQQVPLLPKLLLHAFNGPFSRTTRVCQYQKGKTSLDFTETRDSEWQWHDWASCKSTPRFRQIAMPAPDHSVFYRPDALASNSIKALLTPKYTVYLLFAVD